MKRKLQLLSIYFILACFMASTMSLVVVHADTYNPFVSLPMAGYKNGVGTTPTLGSAYGIYGGIADLMEHDYTIDAIVMHRGGGWHDQTNIRTYGISWRVTLDSAYTTHAVPVFSLAVDSSLLMLIKNLYLSIDGTSYSYDLYSCVSTGLSGNAKMYYPDNGTVRSYDANGFKDITFINIYLPSDVSSGTSFYVGFDLVPMSHEENADIPDAIDDFLMFPFYSTESGTVLRCMAVLSDCKLIAPFIYLSVFTLLAGMIGKFML